MPLPFDETAGSTSPSAFGAYRVLHQIGSGVLGPVFRTYEPSRDRLLAVKSFRLEIVPEQVAQLAEALRRLVATAPPDPRLVPLVEAGLEGTTAYLVMEFVLAETLDVALRHLAPAPLDRAVPILAEIAEALDAAWAAGLGHGALHPRDVFVTPGSHDIVLTGVGLAATLETIGLRAPVRRPYAAPERVDEAAWDVRADVFSLGAIAHELLTRRRPAGPGEQDGALVTGTTPEQRVQIRRVLSSALADRPEDRFATPSAFVAALAAVARGETAGRLPFEDEAAAGGDLAAALPRASSSRAEPSSRKLRPSAVIPLGWWSADEETEETDEETEETEEPSPAHPIEPGEPDEFEETPEPDSEPLAPQARQEVEQALARQMAPEAVERPGRSWERAAPPAGPAVAEPAFAPPPFAMSTSVFDPIEPLPPPRYPWAAIIVVALACLVVGGVGGYFVGNRRALSTTNETSNAMVSRPDDTEVSVPAAPPPTGTPETTPLPPPGAGGTDAASTADVAPTSAPPSPAALDASTAGRLLVRSEPSGATIMIDGRAHGQTPAAIRDLSLGTHTLILSHAGYAPRTERVTLTSAVPTRNMTLALSAAAAAARPAQTTGSIFVDTRPRGARVLIDGRLAGTTPVSIPDVAAGTHAVRLELAGRQPQATTVTVKPGEQARVTATLQDPPAGPGGQDW